MRACHEPEKDANVAILYRALVSRLLSISPPYTVDSIKSFIDGETHISKAFNSMNLIFCMSLIETLLGCLTG